VHRLVAKQIAKATDATGAVDMRKLVALSLIAIVGARTDRCR